MPVHQHTAIVPTPFKLLREPGCIGTHANGTYYQVCSVAVAICEIYGDWPAGVAFLVERVGYLDQATAMSSSSYRLD